FGEPFHGRLDAEGEMIEEPLAEDLPAHLAGGVLGGRRLAHGDRQTGQENEGGSNRHRGYSPHLPRRLLGNLAGGRGQNKEFIRSAAPRSDRGATPAGRGRSRRRRRPRS